MAAHDHLYQRDPEAWRAHLAEGNARQPRKRAAADVIFRDEAGRILLVNDELDAFRFCTETEAARLLRPYVWRRTQLAIQALATGQATYAHHGESVWP